LSTRKEVDLNFLADRVERQLLELVTLALAVAMMAPLVPLLRAAVRDLTFGCDH
jgi:hypothetical protein